MKISKLKQRLRKDRAMSTISLRIPEDVVEDLKKIAPRLGFSGYQSLIRAYVGQGLRADLERLEENPELTNLVESLRRHGVKDEIIASAMAEVRGSVEAASQTELRVVISFAPALNERACHARVTRHRIRSPLIAVTRPVLLND